MAVRHGRLTAIHVSLFFSQVSQMSIVSRVFGLQLRNLAVLLVLFFVMGFIFLVDEIQLILISSHHICIRSIHCGWRTE